MNTNKVALVTGGSSGIGRSIVLELSKLGYAVVVNYSKDDNLAADVINEVNVLGGVGQKYRADITQEEEVKGMIEYMKENFGKIDTLVNNAGHYLPALIEDHSVDDWDKIFNLNLRAKLMCTKHSVELLKLSVSPRIINIASRSAVKPMEESAAYCSAAAAIVMFSQVSALELSKYGIRVNTISPGLTKTPMTLAVDTEEDFEEYANNNPLKRVGSTEDIAKAVAFLASDSADFINGENINVSGGILLK